MNNKSLVQASETEEAEQASDLASDLPGHCPDYLLAVNTGHLAPQIR